MREMYLLAVYIQEQKEEDIPLLKKKIQEGRALYIGVYLRFRKIFRYSNTIHESFFPFFLLLMECGDETRRNNIKVSFLLTPSQ
jgi:hypothetical protein